MRVLVSHGRVRPPSTANRPPGAVTAESPPLGDGDGVVGIGREQGGFVDRVRRGSARGAVRGRGRSLGRRRRSRRARGGAATLSGVWTNTVGVRPSASQAARTGSHGCQPARVWAGSSVPTNRTTGWSVRARRRRGRCGFWRRAPRSAATRRYRAVEGGGVEADPLDVVVAEQPLDACFELGSS